MALDKSKLAQALKTTFQNAKDQSWSSDQVADSLATAIAAYVTAAEVIGVTVNVVNAGNVQIGTGSQTGTGKLQ